MGFLGQSIGEKQVSSRTAAPSLLDAVGEIRKKEEKEKRKLE
jgi:hypothetical protein